MKNNLLVAVIASLLLVACASAPDADKASTVEQQNAASLQGEVYSIDTTASTVTWIGTKPTAQHTGTFLLDSGAVAVNNDQLTGGTFLIDINSLTNLDLEGEYKGKLEGHLKSADFFDVEKYPVSKFVITKVEPFDSSKAKSVLANPNYLISGNLTLKDSTKNVTFPAVVNVSANTVEAKANFNIDRSQWGMSYGNDQSLQDKFIRPEVNIQFDLKARK